MDIKFDKFEEQAFLNTVLVENLTDNETGTGFLVSKPLGDKQKILLFSNKHVFWGKKDKDKKGIEKTLRLTLHQLDEGGLYKPGKVHAFTGKITRAPEKGYYEHADESVDVACVNISDLNNHGLKLNLHYLLIEDFCRFKREELFAGMKILFVGYPSGFYDKTNFLPVMRSGTIASIPVVDFDGKPNILLDAQVFPGSSGSPVFAPIKGQYQLLGIISSGVRKGLDFIEIDNSSKSTEIKEKTNIPVEWLGLGLLFTSDTIREIYALA